MNASPDTLNTNVERLKNYLAPYQSGGIQNLINGQSVAGGAGEVFTTHSPIDESLIANVARGNASDIDAAARAAKAAFNEWSNSPGSARRAILHRIADLIVERAEEIAFCESWDTGQALRFMSKAALRGAENFRYFADQAPNARNGQSLPTASHMNVTSRRAIGPVGVITPWNTPFMLSTWKIAPALAAGCTVVHKPAEFSPLTARILAEIAHEAGLPDGVWNLVNGFGEDAGRALTEHPDIKAISFVGESSTGSMITKQGADTLKRLHLELGGKNPVVVFDDAKLDRALDAAIFMIYSLNGERCTSSSRLLIQKSVAKEFREKLIKRVNNIRVGHPLDPNTEIGPLIHKTHFDKVMSYMDIAKKDGASIVAGGERIGTDGWFVQPTLFADATQNMRISQEEIFGPVLTMIEFGTEEEALEIANSTAYGLAGYLWTENMSRALRFSDAMDAGMVWVNSENIRHLPTPFGGVKSSGIGRDGGDWSFEFYMEQKNVAFAMGEHRIPQLGA